MIANELWERKSNDGAYYISLLPTYHWKGLSDIDYLDFYLSKSLTKKANYSLELASGTGRATNVLLGHSNRVTAVEINPAMLASCYLKDKRLTLVNRDMNDFIQTEPLERYNLIFSFWGPYPNKHSTVDLLTKVSPGTKGIFFHANRGLLEQKIVREILHKYKDSSYDPTRDISDKEESFTRQLELHNANDFLNFSVESVNGESTYPTLDFAVESFLNFHLMDLFEKSTYLSVYEFLENTLSNYIQSSGEVRIPSGMKIFNFIKN